MPYISVQPEGSSSLVVDLLCSGVCLYSSLHSGGATGESGTRVHKRHGDHAPGLLSRLFVTCVEGWCVSVTVANEDDVKALPFDETGEERARAGNVGKESVWREIGLVVR